MASRTDRGVNALGNVVALDTDGDPRRLIDLVRRMKEEIWLSAYSSVSSDFVPRHALWRWYRYYLPMGVKVSRLRQASELFKGSHDFSSYAKKSSSGICNIETIDVKEGAHTIVLDLRGDRFLWNMVRRVVAALMVHNRGELSLEDLREGLQGKPLRLAPAEAERLCLMGVHHQLDWSYGTSAPDLPTPS